MHKMHRFCSNEMQDLHPTTPGRCCHPLKVMRLKRFAVCFFAVVCGFSSMADYVYLVCTASVPIFPESAVVNFT